VSETTEFVTGQANAPASPPAPADADGAEAPVSSPAPAVQRPRGDASLASMLLPQLQRLAQSLGITGTGRMRKSQLIEAIQDRAIFDERGHGASSGPQHAQARDQAAGPSGPAAHGGAANAAIDNSAERGAPAGAGQPRPHKQDAMQPDDTSNRETSPDRQAGNAPGQDAGPQYQPAAAPQGGGAGGDTSGRSQAPGGSEGTRR